MIKPTSRNINFLALVITVFAFFVIIFIHNYWIERDRMKLEVSFNPNMSLEADEKNTDEVLSNSAIEPIEEKNITNLNWTIEIPEIDLVAEISEGTTKEIMNQFVGHFQETSIEYGNIGLAAHNRGYPVNYFQNLKNLKEGSEISYKHGEFNMTYIVKTMEIIENTNWDYLQNTEDNRITLITCVENEPKYRRCIQGIEKIESEEQ